MFHAHHFNDTFGQRSVEMNRRWKCISISSSYMGSMSASSIRVYIFANACEFCGLIVFGSMSLFKKNRTRPNTKQQQEKEHIPFVLRVFFFMCMPGPAYVYTFSTVFSLHRCHCWYYQYCHEFWLLSLHSRAVFVACMCVLWSLLRLLTEFHDSFCAFCLSIFMTFDIPHEVRSTFYSHYRHCTLCPQTKMPSMDSGEKSIVLVTVRANEWARDKSIIKNKYPTTENSNQHSLNAETI